MDATRMLESDHRMVEDLFDQIRKAKGEEREPLISDLRTSLDAHMALEEQVVYRAMEEVTGSETVQEGFKEHELARHALAEMVGLAPDEPGFEAALDVVKAAIDHHVNEEEGTVFPMLRRDGKPALEGMATEFMGKRLELGMPIVASALAASATKDELLMEAEMAGVDGYSSMTKEELAGALVEQMSGSR